LISLHTGAGKSLIGLLIGQSLINEGLSRILYLCASNDLVRQTSREATARLGIDHTTRMGGAFSNQHYERGKGICLTSYQSLFNSRTVFRGDLRPEGIIFDDAHVAETIIRDSYTLRIDPRDNEKIYKGIINLVEPYFSALNASEYLNSAISGTSTHKVILVPPHVMIELSKSASLLELFRANGLHEGRASFALQHLADKLYACSMFISKRGIEISPPFLPSRRIEYLTDNSIRRIYLSATLTSQVDFCRAFGKTPDLKIEPESDAGVGERFIVLADKDRILVGGKAELSGPGVALELSGRHKVLIATSSYLSAEKYRSVASPPSPESFSSDLDTFRRQTTPGAFVMVGRVDGIDLPHATCRMLLADGLPTGFSLHEAYLYDVLEMRNSFAAKLANRITQLFGRTIRGRNDYSVIFAFDKALISWLLIPRNLSLLPELLRKQVLLGDSVLSQFGIDSVSKLFPLVEQILQRDPKWMKFYGDSISGQGVDDAALERANSDDSILLQAALAEAEFYAHLWDGNPQAAREALGGICDQVVLADRRLGGWYNIQIGLTLELDGDQEAAAKQYSEAKSRTTYSIALPVPVTTKSLARDHAPRNSFHALLLQIFINDIRIQNDHIARYVARIRPLFEDSRSAAEHEEATRLLGELLGFDATRPEQEADTGSTLDVLWRNVATKEAILIELKSKKRDSTPLALSDVGQGYNHISWFSENYPGEAALGLIFVGGQPVCSPEASPSPQMWISTRESLKSLYERIISTLHALQRLPPLQRFGEINALVQRPEWQPSAIFAEIRGLNAAEAKAAKDVAS
jgi:hypothetical protein